VDLTLPKGLTDRQSARVLRRQALELSYQGLPENEIEQRVAELRASSEEDARKQLKLFFILDQAAKQLDVDVTENEVNGRIAMLANQQGRRPEKLRQQMQRSGELEHLFLQIREQKTLDKILETAAVTEVEPPAEEKKEEAKPAKKKPSEKKAKKE
jgi:trigger factor